MLAAELETAESAVAEELPELPFRVRRVVTHLSGVSEDVVCGLGFS